MNFLASIPFLSVRWDVSPEAFHIGPLHVRYYGLMFIFGFTLGYYLFILFFKRDKLPVQLLDPLLYVLVGCTIVGARLGHVLFYEPAFYLAHPWKIFAIWEGGLASHGGAIAILFGMWWYARHYGKKYGFDMLWLMDRVGITVAFAGMFIRLGNLMNSEIYGDPTTLPWGFIFVRNGEVFPKHPTQIYEALSYLILGIVLLLLYYKCSKQIKRGFLFGLFLTGLFGARFLIEFIKMPQVGFEQDMMLDMGQWLSVPFIIAGIWLMLWSFKSGKSMMIERSHVNTKPKVRA